MAVSPVIMDMLRKFGLESLAEWASNALINGWSEQQVSLELYERPEFKTRFAGMETLRRLGKPAISVDEYLAYEKFAHAQADMWGMELTKDEVDGLIGNNVSNVELERRFDLAAAAVYETAEETRSELDRLFGVTTGQQMKYWMQPNKELGVLQQQYRMAETAGAAIKSGFGMITADQALRLTQAGLTREQAITGFSDLVGMGELFTPLNIGEAQITQDQQIDLLAGDASIKEMLEKRAETRQAEFAGGGGYATSQEGFATGVAD